MSKDLPSFDDDFQVDHVFKGPGFAETLFLGSSNGRRTVRKASNCDACAFSRTALVREILLLSSLPDNIKPHFVDIYGTNLGDRSEFAPDLPETIWYDMPFYDPEDGWITLSDGLLDGVLDKARALKALDEIIDVTFNYFKIDEYDPMPDYAETTMLASIRESLEWAFKDPDFKKLMALDHITIGGKPVPDFWDMYGYFLGSPRVRYLLTPFCDRFIHGDFFPENILYNTETSSWLLFDPVSVRGVNRGDFVLDLNKMDDWLSGELPALRMGQFNVEIHGQEIEMNIYGDTGKLENLRRLGLSEHYRERLQDSRYAGLFEEEKGWEARWKFVKAFYAFCMLPLTDKKQAIARYFLAVRSMSEFMKIVE